MGSLLKESPLRGKTRRRLWIFCRWHLCCQKLNFLNKLPLDTPLLDINSLRNLQSSKGLFSSAFQHPSLIKLRNPLVLVVLCSHLLILFWISFNMLLKNVASVQKCNPKCLLHFL